MTQKNSQYFRDLSNGKLSLEPIKPILDHMGKIMKLEKMPPELVRSGAYGSKVTEQLTRLDLSIVEGNNTWEGLAVAFPGGRHDLTTRNMTTPYLRMILYPILDVYHRIQKYEKRRMPCIYIVGDRFSDVLLRKFSLLNTLVPRVIILTNDLYNSANRKVWYPATKMNSDHESWWQMQLCKKLNSEQGLKMPVKDGKGFIEAGLLSYEVPAAEGTQGKERLDILCYDKKDHSLIAFEIKGPKCGKVELENLFLQGLEHQKWLERNKAAVKFIFDRGPRGQRISMRKRVRLVLGSCSPETPSLFEEIREQAERVDPYLKIDFVWSKKDGEGDIKVMPCERNNKD
ncbi:MAG: hypothetical protein J7L72_07995 [Candidatus Aminicenantes bacterium]|nr:hypothetical protein [Candidatus Aminicenantes bacterium]